MVLNNIKSKNHINFRYQNQVKNIFIFLISLTLLTNILSNQGEKTITKENFITFYKNFFKENNPLPEIAELYKDKPNFFESLGEQLVKDLPNEFPIEYVKDMFNSEKINKAIEEMKEKNLNIDQYNEMKIKEKVEKLKKEKEAEQKNKESAKQKTEEKQILDEKFDGIQNLNNGKS